MSHHHLTGQALTTLNAGLRGSVSAPGDPAYDAARAAWNLAVDQHPAAVVRAADEADVSAAVRFAGEHGLAVAVQATGHGVALPADDALLLLTNAMDGVQVEVGARTARVEAGARWGRVLEKTTPDGLAPLLGSSPDVGAVGYTLGGGLGWLARRYGLAADSVRSFEVVTADGRRLRADASQNRDLFWGLRGGGAGSLAVVTAMEIGLFPVTEVYGGNLFYPADMALEVAARYAEWIAAAPEELTSSLALMNMPPLEMVPDFLRGRSFAIVRGCHSGSREDAEQLLRFWRDWRAPEFDLFAPMPFSAVAMISNDPVDPMPGGASTEWLHSLDEQVAGILIQQAFPQDGGSPVTLTEVRHVGGALGRADRDAASFGHRDASLLLEMVGVTPGPQAMEALQAHLARVRAQLRPHTTGGAYLNFLEGEEKAGRTKAAFTAEGYARLQELKRQYDPQNLFRYGIDLIGS
jgi:FAD/FMN-containing dehydrogenase